MIIIHPDEAYVHMDSTQLLEVFFGFCYLVLLLWMMCLLMIMITVPLHCRSELPDQDHFVYDSCVHAYALREGLLLLEAFAAIVMQYLFLGSIRATRRRRRDHMRVRSGMWLTVPCEYRRLQCRSDVLVSSAVSTLFSFSGVFWNVAYTQNSDIDTQIIRRK